MVAAAEITDISFPEVAQGEIVSGTVTVENIGDEPTSEATGYLGILVKTLWDGQEYPSFTYYALAPGETYTWLFPAVQGGIGTMPAGPAEVEVTSRRWLGGVWEVDDVVYYSINFQEPLPKPSIIKTLAVTLGPIVVGAIISRKR